MIAALVTVHHNLYARAHGAQQLYLGQLERQILQESKHCRSWSHLVRLEEAMVFYKKDKHEDSKRISKTKILDGSFSCGQRSPTLCCVLVDICKMIILPKSNYIFDYTCIHC